MDENTDTDIRTRDLAERQSQIMDGGLGSPWEPPRKPNVINVKITADTSEFDESLRRMQSALSAPIFQAHPRRIDWYRVAALTIVILAACAATAALIVALALVLTAF